MTLQDLTLLEESLFLNMKSKGYDDTVSALQIALDKVIAKIALIEDDTWTRQQLITYKKMLTDAINDSYGGLFAAMQSESVASAEIIGAYMAISTKVLPQKVIDDLINSKREITGYGFAELFKTQSDNHARALRVILGSGVAQGIPAKQIVKELLDKNNTLSKGQLKTAVFTTIKDSREHIRGNRYKEYEKMGIVDHYVWDSTLDGVTSEICRSRSGRKYYIAYDDIPDACPAHPNCRSVITMVSTNNYTTNIKSSMFGEVKNEPYPTWLKGLDEDKQKLVLGRKFNAYKNNTYKITSFADIRGVTSHSLEDISQILNNKDNFN